MRLSRFLSQHSTDAANIQESVSIILIYVQRCGRYGFSNELLHFAILVNKRHIKNHGR
jgi:hypothetical protein